MSKIFCGSFYPIILSTILTFLLLLPASAAIANIKKTTPNSNEVSLYVASWCSHCRKAKEYLDQLKVAYTLYDIDTPNGQEKFDALDAQGIPIITVGKHRMDGFNAAQLTKILCEHAILENCSGALP